MGICTCNTHTQRWRDHAKYCAWLSCADIGLWPVMTASDPDTDICSIQMNISLSMSAIHLCQSLSASLPVYLFSLPVTYLSLSLSLSLCLSANPPITSSLSYCLFFLSPLYLCSTLRQSQDFSLSLSFIPHQLRFIDGFLDALCFPPRSFLLLLHLSLSLSLSHSHILLRHFVSTVTLKIVCELQEDLIPPPNRHPCTPKIISRVLFLLTIFEEYA